MKGLILSGGSGTRMRPLTHSTAKQLLPIGNRPILHRAVMQLCQVGITEIVVVVGSTAEQVQASLGNGHELGANVTYVQQDQPLGLAHCVKIAHNYLGDDDFLMFLGDNMFEESLEGIIKTFKANKSQPDFAAQVAVKEVSNPSSFGVAEVDSDFNLLSVQEKPEFPRSNLALVGTYCFTPQIHKAVDALTPSARGELEITDAIQYLVASGSVVGVSQVGGWWFDTGNPSSFLECNAKFLDGMPNDVPSHTNDVTIIDPCCIDSSARLSNCTVGPHVSVGAYATIDGVDVKNSVVFEEATISGSGAVIDSILGKRSSLITEHRVASKVVLGDDCFVEMSSE